MLTIKQEKFCIEYAKCGNARQAYINAGYKYKSDKSTDANASRLLNSEKVKKRLAELAEEIKNDSIADMVEMQQTLTKIIRQTATEEVIVSETNGMITESKKMEKAPSVKDVISAINTLGKMQGLFTEKVEQNVDMELNITVDYGDE